MFKNIAHVSLVLLAYNEVEGLKETVLQVADALQKITPAFEIIIAEDGSTDGTDKIAEILAYVDVDIATDLKHLE